MIPEESFVREGHHIQRVLSAAPFSTDPFTHIYAPEFFSRPFYAALKEFMPPISAYEAYLGSDRRPFGKFGFPLWVEELTERTSKLPPEPRIFWERFVSHTMVSLYGALLDKFAAFIALRFGEGDDVPLKLDARLAVDITGSQGYVHTDNPDFVLTFLVYLPDDTALEEYGTGLYTPQDPDYRDVGNGSPTPMNFPTVHKVPFRPNTMVGFFKTGRSFHGLETIGCEGIMRHTLIVHVKGRAEYFAERYGVEIFDKVFSKRTVHDFEPLAASLRNCERVFERGLIDEWGNRRTPPMSSKSG